MSRDVSNMPGHLIQKPQQHVGLPIFGVGSHDRDPKVFGSMSGGPQILKYTILRSCRGRMERLHGQHISTLGILGWLEVRGDDSSKRLQLLLRLIPPGTAGTLMTDGLLCA